MAEIIAVVSGKGGTGKTTLTANLGAALVSIEKKVLLVDCVPGNRNLDIVLGVQNETVYDFLDVLEDRCGRDDAILSCHGLDFLPAPQGSSAEQIPPERFQAFLAGMQDSYDYILLDASSGVGTGFMLASSSADTALIVTTPELMSVRGGEKAAAALEHTNVQKIFTIINKISIDLIKKDDMIDIDSIIQVIAAPLLGAIPFDLDIIGANNRGTPLALNSGSRFAQACTNTARRLTGEKVPILQDEGYGAKLFKKLFHI